MHISTASTVTIVFNLPITSAYFEGFGVSVNGCTVVLTREQHGNAYNSNDQYDTLLKVYCEDPDFFFHNFLYESTECAGRL